MTRPVSVIINSNGRPEGLRRILAALRWLDYAAFEVIVVLGPDNDGVQEVQADFGDDVVWRSCAIQNLSASRNIGIAASAGDLVAFIDDDAVPDPSWLDDVAAPFDDPEVAATGGPVLNHTGAALQALFSCVTRGGLSEIVVSGPNPSDMLSAPDSWMVPYPTGTNSCFRRSALVAIGGFDEEFEYYLDESDVCVRLVDRGWRIQLLERGLVHHGFLPGVVRGATRAVDNWAPIIKSLVYFAERHGMRGPATLRAAEDLSEQLRRLRTACETHVSEGLVAPETLDAFDAARTDEAIRACAAADLPPRTQPPEFFDDGASFRRFSTLRPRDRRLHLCFMSKEAPPGPLNGIARVTWDLARGLAAAGHVVRLLTRTDSSPSVELAEGVWVHRVVVRGHEPAARVPADLWDYSASLLDELLEIDSQRPIDVVEFPNWDLEGVAVVADGRFRTSMGLYTPLLALIESDERLSPRDERFALMTRAERDLYARTSGLSAPSRDVVEEIEGLYGLKLPGERITYAPHAIPDLCPDARRKPATGDAQEPVTLLFVGRLEPRKGIDVLLSAAASVLGQGVPLELIVVGDASQSAPGGATYPDTFRREHPGLAREVRFAGKVDDGALHELYDAADVVVVPSRYESFGLVAVEAMMHARPVVASAAGGLSSVVRDGETGLLVPPGDAAVLASAITRLAGDAQLRMRMGEAGRRRYLADYSLEGKVSAANAYYDRIAGRRTAGYTAQALLPLRAAGALAGDPERPADFSGLVRCPKCRGGLDVAPRVVNTSGRVKTGSAVCLSCGCVAAEVRNFRMNFHRFGERHVEPAQGRRPRRVEHRGERRLLATQSAGVTLNGRWHEHGGCLRSSGDGSDWMSIEVACSDALLRLMRTPDAGLVDIEVDGAHVERVDLWQSEGTLVLPLAAIEDEAVRPHTIVIRPVSRGSSDTGRVYYCGTTLLGPSGGAFGPWEPVNFGNDWSAALERWVGEVPADEWILECGGGDRRSGARNRINFEYLPFELADVYGDIHELPFADDSFALVLSQAVFEHVRDPRRAAKEMLRVTRPGGVIALEVAFMQPLHAVPSHYYNMTPWGARELFPGCEVLEEDQFGGLAGTVEWLLRASGIAQNALPAAVSRVVDDVALLEGFATPEGRRAVASGVYLAVRVP